MPLDPPSYPKPGKHTGGINDMVLLYNGWYEGGKGDLSKDDIMPYILYSDASGQPQDWMYDGVLMLGLWTEHFGGDMGTGTTDLAGWQWYLDKTFAPEGDMHALNEATKEAGVLLNDRRHRTKVVLALTPIGYWRWNGT